MKIRYFTKALVVLIVTVFFSRCSTSPLAGGNSSQTGNAGIAVTASDQSIFGITDSGAHVAIFEQNYRPYLTPSGICDSTIADNSGRFSFSIVQVGLYNLVVIDQRRGNAAAFIPNIPVYPDSTFTRTIDSLKKNGYISGVARDSMGVIYPLFYLFINGTPFYTVTKNNGDFLLGPLPPGMYKTRLFAISSVDSVKPFVGPNPLRFISLDTSSVVVVTSDSITAWR